MKRHIDIRFHVEPADPGVGIFGEDFAAWKVDSENEEWCSIPDVAKKKFEWFNGNGDQIDRSEVEDAGLIEGALWGFMEAYYQTKHNSDVCPEEE